MQTDFRVDSSSIAAFEETPEGYGRLYIRLSRADSDLVYTSMNGEKRIEVCEEAELFKADSLATFQSLPFTDEHPPGGRMDSSMFALYGKGSTHPQFVQEITPVGSFLGQMATVYDRSLVSRIKSGEVKGVSPGYRCGTGRQRADGRIPQRDRQGNHVAATVAPRDQSATINLAGIRTDSADSIIWVQDYRADAFDVPVSDLIQPLLTNWGDAPMLVKKTATNLDLVDLDGKLPKADSEDEECSECGEDCDCDDCTAAAAAKKTKDRKRSSKQRSDSMIQVMIGDVPVQVEERDALRVQTELKRLEGQESRADSLELQLADRTDSLADAAANAEYVGELETALTEASEYLQKVAAGEFDAEDDGDRADSEDGEFFTEKELTEFAVGAVLLDRQMRGDAGLVGVDLDEAYGRDVRADSNLSDAANLEMVQRASVTGILADTTDLRRQLLAIAVPDFRADSLEDDQIDLAYDLEFSKLRNAAPVQAQTRNGAPQLRADSAPGSYVAGLKTIGQIATTSGSAPAKSYDAAWKERQDAAFASVGK